MKDIQKILESLFKKYHYSDYKWIDPKNIIISQWVRLKCIYGCTRYRKNASCPPNVPTIQECKNFFNEYTKAVIFHFENSFDKPEDRYSWAKCINQKLLKLEREVFLLNYPKAFLLPIDECRLCDDCFGTRIKCNNPQFLRPPPEAMGIDVFSTVKQYGYPIKVLTEYTEKINRYAFLLIE